MEATSMRSSLTALMSTESIGLVVVLSILALGTLYAVKGSLVSAQWWAWIRGACFAAGIVFAIGILTLGLPGTMFVEVLIPAGRKLPPDSAWPLALLITQVGALIIVPVSLALRFAMPNAVGWHHAWVTALASIAATFLFTMAVTPQALP